MSWRELVKRRIPKWLLRWMVAAYWPLPRRRPKTIILPVWGGAYVRFPFKFLAPDPGLLFPDHDYFRILRPGKGETVLDVGAGVGFSSVMAARFVKKEGLVVAIEPEPESLKWLRANLQPFQNSIVVEKGVLDHEGFATLFLSLEGCGGSILPRSGGRSIKIRVTTIDRICKELGLKRVDFLMMDVEGAELMALRGARETLKKTRRIVVAAYHRVKGNPTWPRVKRFLEKMRFCTTVTEDGLVHGWKNNSSPRLLRFNKKTVKGCLNESEGGRGQV